MRFHVCDSASVSGWCLMALYFAPMDAASNSGRFSSQTFRTSSLISGRTFLDARRKAFVRAIEFDLSPRGDDWPVRLRTRYQCLKLVLLSRRESEHPS